MLDASCWTPKKLAAKFQRRDLYQNKGVLNSQCKWFGRGGGGGGGGGAGGGGGGGGCFDLF